MRYCVTYKIDARFITVVEAENIEEAKKKAEDKYLGADFGLAEDIDGEAIIIEDEKGDYVWEK